MKKALYVCARITRISMENTNETEVICKCPNCGASMKMHWHRLSKGLVTSLIKFRKQVIALQRNKVQIQKEGGFTKIEYNNFQKLRYHGLVAKYVNPENKQHEAGYWLLTKRGNQFCKNMLQVPVKVQTFRNKISDKASELVYLSDVLKGVDVPVWDKIDDFGYDFADITEMEEVKFDANGQGTMFN